MEILLGTNNSYKQEVLKWCFEGVDGVNFHYLSELSVVPRVVEDRKTLKENAEKKAREISKLTDLIVVTSDTGIAIPGLAGWNYLTPQRNVGEDATDVEKVQTLLKLMNGLTGEERRCFERTALALAKRGKVLWSWEGGVDSAYISELPLQSEIPLYNWVGHVWYYPQYKRVYNELSDLEKEQLRQQSQPMRIVLKVALKDVIKKC